MRNQPRKLLLLNTAYRLFNEHGYHATGIDTILAESGVSKATLYKHYRSKETLILAVLEMRHNQLIAACSVAIEAAQDQQQPVLAIFDVLHEWFKSDSFFGCNFLKASAEYAHIEDEIYQYAQQHKVALTQLLENTIKGGTPAKRKKWAKELSILIDGAIMFAHSRRDHSAALSAKKMAEALITTNEKQ